MQEQDNAAPVLRWTENDAPCAARWRSEAGLPPPKRVVIADDRLTADTAYRFACEGTAMLWRGDFQNARQLLQAMMRRIDRKPKKAVKPAGRPQQPMSMTEAFHLHRQAQSQRARTLAMLLLPLDGNYKIPLRRAPDVRQACEEAYGAGGEASVVSLREVLGLIGAHEWRKNGVEIPALGARIHPHYGVFSPVRGEYIDLVAQAPLPSTALAFDIGTGTGVLAAVLAMRGVAHVVATDQDSRALACTRENIERLGLLQKVELQRTDLFPAGRAGLVVCNPPWIPARPSSPIESAIYDPESRMLRGFLGGLAEHLEADGEGWLILSDIAEHLGLRSRDELLAWIEAGGLKVIGKIDTRPTHAKATAGTDLLHAARSAEVTSLWRLARQ
ncbi:methyltransferase [Lacisediminimonas profundi]|uniref:methyltransferase n=1 Tax=Lacisediminimonas profundi TaxID=2603856 RepID=UPI00124BB8B2|nr:class I SAM-dependent methyltransferase [Lacisediminimonas profundi]